MPTWDETTPYTERSTFSKHASVTNALLGVHLVALAAAAIIHFSNSNVFLVACGFQTVPAVFGLEAWRFITFPFVPSLDPESLAVFALFGWLFLRAGNELERNWGGARMLGFCSAMALYGAGAQTLYDVVSGRVEHSPLQFMGGLHAPVLGVLLANALRSPRRPALLFMLVPLRTITLFWLVFGGALIYGVLKYSATVDTQMAYVTPSPIAMFGAVVAAAAYVKLDPRLDRFLEWLDTRRARAKFLEEFELRAQVDVLLDKIQRSGLAALTRQERKTLRRASGLYRPPSRPSHE